MVTATANALKRKFEGEAEFHDKDDTTALAGRAGATGRMYYIFTKRTMACNPFVLHAVVIKLCLRIWHIASRCTRDSVDPHESG